MLVYWFCAASPAGAQTKSVADLANYRGADREEVLKAGAKKEGKLVWYTTRASKLKRIAPGPTI